MRNVIALVVLVVLAVFAFSGCTKVEPGYVGIVVNNYGSQRGVSDFPIKTGRVWYNPFTEDVYKFPTFLQTVSWTRSPTEGSSNDDSITFNSIEGATINADIALSYQFEAAKVPNIFVEFRQDAESITWGYMRSQVRDTFSRIGSKMRVLDIFGERKQEFLEAVKTDLNKRLAAKGFHFDMISFIGALRVDDRVTASINAVIEATQRAIEAENKVRQTEAEARQRVVRAEGEAKAITTIAKAQADANKILTESLTPDLIRWQAVKNWDGKLPQVTGNGGIPLIEIETNQPAKME